MTLSIESLPLTILLLFAVTAVPVKLGASFVGAQNDGFGPAAISAIMGLIAGMIVMALFSGPIVLVICYLTMSAIYWFVLKPSLPGALGLTFIVLILQVAIVQGLFSILGSAVR